MDAHGKSISVDFILRSSYLPSLDGLRAVAILIVMTYHFGFNQVPGDLGVNLFFVLSGLLITRLILREYGQSGAIDLTHFHRRRMLRIFPAYYSYLLFTFTADCLRGHCWTPGLLLVGLTHVVNYYNALNGHPITPIAHAWALSLQEQFYLIWPWIFVFLAKRGTKVIVLSLGFSILAVLVWRLILIVEVGATSAYLYNAFDTRFDSLAIGCLIPILAQFPILTTRVEVIVKSPLMPLGTVSLLLISRMCGSEIYHYAVGFTIDTVLICILVIQVLLLHRHWMYTWLDCSIARYMGKISYSLYLWHGIGFSLTRKITNVQFVTGYFLALLICIGLASASYWFIEKPFLRIKEGSKPSST